MSKGDEKASKQGKPEGYTIPIILKLLDIPADALLAKRLGYKSPSFISKWKNEVGVTIPPDKKQLLIQWLQTEVTPPILLKEADFNLDKLAFLGRIPKDHPKYAEACRSAGIEPEQVKSRTFEQIHLLYGRYVRLFFCRDPANTEKDAITLDDFEIFPVESDAEAQIVQLTYDFEDALPQGIVRVRGGDTIEIRIDYEIPRQPSATFVTKRHPNGVYLAPFPKGNKVNAILTMELDVTNEARDVSARPMLFIRVPEFFDNGGFYGPETEIFKSVKTLFENSLEVNLEKFRITPMAVREHDLSKVIAALKALREAALATDCDSAPPEGMRG